MRRNYNLFYRIDVNRIKKDFLYTVRDELNRKITDLGGKQSSTKKRRKRTIRKKRSKHMRRKRRHRTKKSK